ncbi:MAG: apolipoprotein N-acyltransferase [Cellulomonas sp.]|nr:apolipoprotein N-acyltransferase [Cellulomonas sp.]
MTAPIRSRGASLALAVAGGVAATVAFPDAGIWVGAPLGMALLHLAMARDGARWNALVGGVFGVAFFAPLIWWVEVSVGDVPWLGLSVLESLAVAVFAAAWTWARRAPIIAARRWLQVLVFAALWVATEELRSAVPFGGFPWGRLAFSQTDSPLLPLAWLGGAPLVSGVTAAIGALLAHGLLALRRRTVRSAVLNGTGVIALLLVGLLIPLDTSAQQGDLRVGVVQGDVPGEGLEAFGRQWQVLENHITGTEALLDVVRPGDLDLVLWPENGSDVDPQVNADAAAMIDAAAQEVDAPMLVGTVQYPETGGRYNTSVLWEPGVGVVAQYSKQHPAPFAEYIPFRSVARHFSSAVDLVTQDMLPGRSPAVIPLESARLGRTVRLGTVICFEVAYDALVRASVTGGGEVLVVQTNNASFGRTAESTQQLAMTRFRAVEHGRAAVQVSTVGVSAVILPDGTVTQQTGLFTAEQMVASLALRETQTPATRWGPWIAGGVEAFALAALVLGVVGARHPRRHDRIEHSA